MRSLIFLKKNFIFKHLDNKIFHQINNINKSNSKFGIERNEYSLHSPNISTNNNYNNNSHSKNENNSNTHEIVNRISNLNKNNAKVDSINSLNNANINSNTDTYNINNNNSNRNRNNNQIINSNGLFPFISDGRNNDISKNNFFIWINYLVFPELIHHNDNFGLDNSIDMHNSHHDLNYNELIDPVREVEDMIINELYPNPDSMTYEQLLEFQDNLGYVDKGFTKNEIEVNKTNQLLIKLSRKNIYFFTENSDYKIQKIPKFK